MKKSVSFLMRRRRGLIAPSIPAIANGLTAEFISAAIQPLSLIAEVAPIRTGVGVPAPDNYMAMTGRTGMKIYQAGKNLMRTTAVSESLRGIDFTVNPDGSITAQGTATSSITGAYVFGIVTLPPGTYYANGFSADTDARILVRDQVAGRTWAYINRGADIEFTLTETTTLTVYPDIPNGEVANWTFYPMIRRTGSPKYEPGHGQEISLSWPAAGAIISGAYDVISGILSINGEVTLTGAENVFDFSGENPNGHVFRVWMPTAGFRELSDAELSLYGQYCTHFRQSITQRQWKLQLNEFYPRRQNIWFCTDIAETTAEFKSWLAEQYSAGTPVVVSAPLISPIKVRSLATKLYAVSGLNSFMTEEGSIIAEYKRFVWQEEGL